MSLLSNAIAIPQKGGYDLTDSVRIRSSASAYLTRTPSSAGNRRTFTVSMWVKRGLLDSTERTLVSAGNRDPSYQNQFWLNWSTTGQLRVYGDAITVLTTAVYRDPSAWYHIVVSVDTTQATASDRIKIYVNGSQVTALTTANYPSLNYEFHWNNTTYHEINRWTYNQSQYGDQYLTELYSIDGQALTPSDFGEYDATTGVWKPKKYTGSYGTNGFYLPMNEETSVYSATYLIVAGGGGGGTANNTGRGGGGGAGGLLSGSTNLYTGTTYSVTVGTGGAGGLANGGAGGVDTRGQNGTNSTALGLTAIGGGGAGGGKDSAYKNGKSGGSGGGGGEIFGGGSGGSGTAGQGNAGASGSGSSGGGGGGAGGAGSGGTGGAGISNSITGSAITYARGGYGGLDPSCGTNISSANSGNGGRGCYNVTAQAGDNGVVIFRVPTADYSGTTTGSPTITTDGSDTIIKFTSSGSYTA